MQNIIFKHAKISPTPLHIDTICTSYYILLWLLRQWLNIPNTSLTLSCCEFRQQQQKKSNFCGTVWSFVCESRRAQLSNLIKSLFGNFFTVIEIAILFFAFCFFFLGADAKNKRSEEKKEEVSLKILITKDPKTKQETRWPVLKNYSNSNWLVARLT